MRLLTISVLGMVAISTASAGQIEIGGNLNSSTGISTGGLDAAYVSTGSIDTWSGGEKGYASILFGGDVISNSSLGGSTLPDGVGGQQFTDPHNNVVFAMDSDSGDNFWASSTATTTANSATSINIPVGVFGTTSAFILLNDYYADGNTDTVTFNFANYGAYSVTLTNGNQIDASTACTQKSPYDVTQPYCTAYSASTSSSGTDNAWTGTYYNTNTSTGSPFSGSATSGNMGTLSLADISFSFLGVNGLNALTDTLNSITITDNNNCAPGEAGCTGAGAINSRLALSAITVETTPEPSTVFLFATGLGVVGFFGRRRKVRQ